MTTMMTTMMMTTMMMTRIIRIMSFTPAPNRTLPEGLKIKDSPIDGQGLFATVEIPSGTLLGLGWAILKGVKWRTPLGGFVNHSDTPNLTQVTEDSFGLDLMLNILTSRDILVDEELTIDYTNCL